MARVAAAAPPGTHRFRRKPWYKRRNPKAKPQDTHKERSALVRAVVAVLALPFLDVATQVCALRVCKLWQKYLRLAPCEFSGPLELADGVWFDNLRRCALDCSNVTRTQFSWIVSAMERESCQLRDLGLDDAHFCVTLPVSLAARLKSLALSSSEPPHLPGMSRLTHLHVVVVGGQPVAATVLPPCPVLEVLQTNLQFAVADVARLPMSLRSLVLDQVDKEALRALGEAAHSLQTFCVRRVSSSGPVLFGEDLDFGLDFEELDIAEHWQPVKSCSLATTLRFRTHELLLDGTSEEQDAAVLTYLSPGCIRSLRVFHKRVSCLTLDTCPCLRSLVLHGVPLELSGLMAVARVASLEQLVMEYNYTHAWEEPNWNVLAGSRVLFLVMLQVWVSHDTERVLRECCPQLKELAVLRRNLESCCQRKLVSYL